MNRCRHPEHPHCTVWVMPGAAACAHGHPQPPPAGAVDDLVANAGPNVVADLVTAPAGAAIEPGALPPQRSHLHVSGFDPRAAGGRQVLKLELRGMPADCAPELGLLAFSRLRLDNGGQHRFTRGARGEWLPVFLEFSSRDLEHGQYRIELELHSPPASGGAARTWVATLLVLVPRPDASLHEIHRTFLASHKNVRVSAVDASIARVQARVGGGSLDIDVDASNAGIAHLDLDAGGGKIDLGMASIAWDEELLELELPRERVQHDAHAALPHPCPASSACLVFEPSAAVTGLAHPVRYLRLFALDECVLGRFDAAAPDADLLLMHHAGGPVPDGLTRRISARHALIRRGRDGYEIEDVSRYGLLVDGVWPGKYTPITLRPGMRIELTASIPGVAVLEVGALLPNGILLHRRDAGGAYEAFCLLDPECDPGARAETMAPGLPLLFHRDGGFWQRDGAGAATPLHPARLPLAGAPRFAARPYPELHARRATRARAWCAPAQA